MQEIFGVVSTDDNASDGYYIVKFVPGPYTMQDETIVAYHIISSR